MIGYQHLPLSSKFSYDLDESNMILILTSSLVLNLILNLILLLISNFMSVSVASVPIRDNAWLRLFLGIFAGGLEFRQWRWWRQLLGKRGDGK